MQYTPSTNFFPSLFGPYIPSLQSRQNQLEVQPALNQEQANNPNIQLH